MVANKYAFLQITRRRFLNEWEAFKKVISRRNIRRRITIPLTLSNLKLLRRITRTENILHRNFTRRQVAIQNRVASNIGISQRDAVQPDIEAERKKRDEIEAGKSYCSRRFGGATCDDKSAQIYARFDKNDWRIQPAEFYRFHDAEVNTFGYF